MFQQMLVPLNLTALVTEASVDQMIGLFTSLPEKMHFYSFFLIFLAVGKAALAADWITASKTLRGRLRWQLT